MSSPKSSELANYELSAKPGSPKQMAGGLAALALGPLGPLGPLGIMDEVAEAFPKSSPDTYADLCHLLWITIYGAACLVCRPAIESWLWNSMEFHCKDAMISTAGLPLSIQNFTLKLGSGQLKSWRTCLQTPPSELLDNC